MDLKSKLATKAAATTAFIWPHEFVLTNEISLSAATVCHAANRGYDCCASDSGIGKSHSFLLSSRACLQVQGPALLQAAPCPWLLPGDP